MFVESMYYCGILIVISFLATCCSKQSYWGIYLLIFVMTLCPIGLLGSVFFLVNAVFLLIVTFLCHWRGARPLTYLASSMLATVIALVSVFVYEQSPMGTVGRARKQFPRESMEDRLAYEVKRHSPTNSNLSRHDAEWLDETETRLANQRPDFNRLGRDRVLALLHENTVEHFVRSPGFGSIRGLPSMSHIDLPEIKSIPLPQGDDEYFDQLGKDPIPRPDFPSPMANLSLRSEHNHLVEDFVNVWGFGHVKDRRHVVGFQPHHFKEQPGLWDHENKRWAIRDLALVSLLKHERPRVYLSRKLPRMDELVDAPTRAVDEFELKGIDLIRKGEDMALATTPAQIRAIGSIRATNQCLKCHQVERGDLLGAFTYLLTR